MLGALDFLLRVYGVRPYEMQPGNCQSKGLYFVNIMPSVRVTASLTSYPPQSQGIVLQDFVHILRSLLGSVARTQSERVALSVNEQVGKKRYDHGSALNIPSTVL